MRRPQTREEKEAEADRLLLLTMSAIHGNKRDRSIPTPDYDLIFSAVENREPFTLSNLLANLSITRHTASSIFGKEAINARDFPRCLFPIFCEAKTYAFPMPDKPWLEHWYTIQQAQDIYHLCTNWPVYIIRQAIREKRLPAYRFSSSCIRLLRHDITAFISHTIAQHNARQPVGHKKSKTCLDPLLAIEDYISKTEQKAAAL